MLIFNPITIIVAGIALLVAGPTPIIQLIGYTIIVIPVTTLIYKSLTGGK